MKGCSFWSNAWDRPLEQAEQDEDMSDDSQDSDSDLLALARQGDRDAINALLARVKDRVETISQARLGAKLRAKYRHSDIVQSTYLEVIRDIPAFEGSDISAFSAWVARILENNIRRKVRHHETQKRKGGSSESERVDLSPDRGASPSVVVARGEDISRIGRALDSLDPRDRDLIRWRVIEQLDYEEVAAKAGLSLTATRTAIWRARAALTLAVERIEGGD